MKLVSLVKVGESVGRYWLNTLGGSGWMGGPKWAYLIGRFEAQEFSSWRSLVGWEDVGGVFDWPVEGGWLAEECRHAFSKFNFEVWNIRIDKDSKIEWVSSK